MTKNSEKHTGTKLYCDRCGCELTRMRIHRHGKIYCYECAELVKGSEAPHKKDTVSDRALRRHHTLGTSVSELAKRYGMTPQEVYERLK